MKTLKPWANLATFLLIVAFSMAVALAAAACSGASPAARLTDAATLACGPGTVASHGQCVVAEAASEAESPPLADTSTPEVITDSSLAEGDSPLDGHDGGAQLTSDPCPTSSSPPIWYDCSGDCVPSGASNGPAACSAAGFLCTTVGLVIPNQISGTFRTPSNASSACKTLCPSSVDVISGEVYFYTPGAPFGPAVVRVAAPWKVTDMSLAPLGSGSCPVFPDAGASTCLVVPRNHVITVWTDDPNPPARNVTFEPSAPGCP
jgi:hypothetical protein